MSCTAIMTKCPLTIAEHETVAEAAAKLIEHHSTSLPVVDSTGGYIGMFGICDLLGLLVPRVALAGNFMSNLRFISDDPRELRHRYEEVKRRRVSEVADRDAARLAPDEPEIEAIRLCCRSRTPIPVVEKETDKVVGIISCWDAIRALAGAP
ncbi:MAG TPA: CBS domain-containing protein [Rhizomicrobium sp.]|jgi:CBS-domain-containing membrane protein|nr:CBS domain-containing protein [Rhizomicrobium sp.]